MRSTRPSLNAKRSPEPARLGLNLTIPTLLDDMDNTVDLLFSGWPERLYVLSPESRVLYQGGKGPFGFDTEGWEKFLAELVTLA